MFISPHPTTIALVLALLVSASCGTDQDRTASFTPATFAPTTTETGADGPEEQPADGESGTAEEHNPIRIPLHNWSSQLVSAKVVGSILETAGFPVEYVPLDSLAAYPAMCSGEVDLVHEVWEPAFGEAFQEQVGQGCVLDWATHDAVTREEWWYPNYMEEMCPGLPHWEALNACASIFATEQTDTKGRYLAGPLDWEYGDAERVEALGMNFEVVNVASADQLWIELEAAYTAQEPIVLLNWTPNFVEAVYEGKFVEFPVYDEDCRTDPAWGVNPALTHDCGSPVNGYLKIGVSARFPGAWPFASVIVKRINFTNAMLAEMAAAVDISGKEADTAAQEWLDANQELWQRWITG